MKKYIVVAGAKLEDLREARKTAHDLCEEHGNTYYLAEVKSIFKRVPVEHYSIEEEELNDDQRPSTIIRDQREDKFQASKGSDKEASVIS